VPFKEQTEDRGLAGSGEVLYFFSAVQGRVRTGTKEWLFFSGLEISIYYLLDGLSPLDFLSVSCYAAYRYRLNI
jgi:hypothetical protein